MHMYCENLYLENRQNLVGGGGGGGKRKVFARDPMLGGSCIPKLLPLKDSNVTGVPQAARKIKGAKVGGQ